MSKYSSAKYYQNNKEKLQKKAWKCIEKNIIDYFRLKNTIN